jgi:hypothetical protein
MTCGLKHLVSAERLCQVSEEVHTAFRGRPRRDEVVALAWPYATHRGRLRARATGAEGSRADQSAGSYVWPASVA